MLRKFNRRTTIRQNFAVDRIYKGLLLDKATRQEKILFNRYKFCSHLLDDDLFVHILIQRDKQFINKINGNQAKRLFPFYPTFIPLIDSKKIISKSEYYWISNTIEYPCIRCNEPTISFYGDYSVRNVLCGCCIKDHYINAKGIYDKRLHEVEYSKFHMDFFKINKEHQNMVFSKLMKRERSYYINNDSLNKNAKKARTIKLRYLEETIRNLTE